MTKRISPLESSREIYLACKIFSNSETVGIYTFFEASHFECRKTVFDTTKVTYNMYSCAISGMSREMMKMDGRDSVECQNWEKGDITVIFGKVFKSQKDKKLIQFFFSNKKGRQKREMQNFGPATIFF